MAYGLQRMRQAVSMAVLTSLSLGALGYADESIKLKSSVELGAAAWSSNRLLDEKHDLLVNTLAVSGNLSLSRSAALQFDGWAYYINQAHANGVQHDDTHRRLRDLYLRLDTAQTEWRLGVQSVAWGRADRLNPTDHLSPRDYSAPFSTDEAQRFGVPMLRVNRDVTDSVRMAASVSAFQPSIHPNYRQEQGLPLRDEPQSQHPASRPEYAIKLDHIGERLDWSFSYFDGYEKNRSLEVTRLGGAAIGMNRGYAPLRVFGADMAYATGAWTLRAESGYHQFKREYVSERAGRVDHLYTVFGLERSLPAQVTINVQYYSRDFSQNPRSDSANPIEQRLLENAAIANNQFHRHQDGISLRFAQTRLNDRLDYEWVVLYNLRDQDYAIRPRLNFRYSDRVKFGVGVDRFYGRSDSYFGALRRNSVGFIEAKLMF